MSSSNGAQDLTHAMFSSFARWRWLPVALRDFLRRVGEAAPQRSSPQRAELEERLGHRFREPELLQQALTHRSHVHVTGMERLESNERLEFLGDSVLGMVVNEFLYDEFTGKEEGELTKIKSLLVCGSTLAKVGERLDLGAHLLLSRSEAGTGGRKRESILADATEAIIGAIYLDGGLEDAKRFIRSHILINVDATLEERTHRNYKSLLQERLQARYKIPPRYKVSYTTGPDHARRFTVKVTMRGTVLGVGSGTSKKQAEQRAAESALSRLDELEQTGELPPP
jgi:ribonuclease-3